jgi:ferrous iron transport protein B
MTRAAPKVALVGRPNSGKSSLYNALTGSRAKVGNFPGVTVDVLEADVDLGEGQTATLCDLPGAYALDGDIDPQTDEGVARTFLEKHRGAGLIVAQVIDATELALGLNLTRQLESFPRLLIVTQHDLLEEDGARVEPGVLERTLGVPVVVTSGRSPTARDQVFAALRRVLVRQREKAAESDATGNASAPMPAWDRKALARAAVIRKETATGTASHVGHRLSERLDASLLHPVLGPVLFLGIMGVLFSAVFLVADPATTATEWALGWVGKGITRVLGEGKLASLLVDGVLGGAGTVLAFMPQIILLTIAMELLDASGYLSRGAFLIDRWVRLLGLSGRSFVPLLMGHACAVPAIGATRVIRDPRERLTTMLVLPLTTCSARLPTYALVIATFFSHKGAFFRAGVFIALYLFGGALALIASTVLRRTATRGRTLPLVLEMPRYRRPQARVLFNKARETAKRFLRDVGSTILIASTALWLLLHVPTPGLAPDGRPDIERSVAATVGRGLEPLTRPAGFDWRINVALLGSLGARELMVSTMGVIMGVENAEDDTATLEARIRDAKTSEGRNSYSGATGLAILAFFVIACQCMSTLAALRRETKSLRWPLFVFGYTYLLAYGVAVAVYQIARVWIA